MSIDEGEIKMKEIPQNWILIKKEKGYNVYKDEDGRVWQHCTRHRKCQYIGRAKTEDEPCTGLSQHWSLNYEL